MEGTPNGGDDFGFSLAASQVATQRPSRMRSRPVSSLASRQAWSRCGWMRKYR